MNKETNQMAIAALCGERQRISDEMHVKLAALDNAIDEFRAVREGRKPSIVPRNPTLERSAIRIDKAGFGHVRKPKKVMSLSARRLISQAMKRRWAHVRRAR